MTDHYIVIDGKPVPEPDIIKWAMWMQWAKRHVAVDHLDGDVHVSTVFLGIDHSFGHGPPVLWETMIFGGPLDGSQWRYASHEGAVRGHSKALAEARAAPGTESA